MFESQQVFLACSVRVPCPLQELLLALAEAANLRGKLSAMASGAHVNITEDRAVMHIALRAARDSTIIVDGADVVAPVYAVLDSIKAFADKVRAGEWKVSESLECCSCGWCGAYVS